MKRKLFENFKIWLDGAEVDSIEGLNRKDRPIKSDDFMNNIIKRLDLALQDEMFLPLNKNAHVPQRFIVYLNKADDLCWQTSKRKALEETLSEVIYQRALELASPNNLSVANITVDVKLDQSLAPQMFHISPIWNDTSETTSINQHPTILDTSATGSSSKTPLFVVRLSDSTTQTDIPFYKDSILIGRGGFDSHVDLTLTNPKISRIQAELHWHENEKLSLTNLGRNSLTINKEAVLPQTTVRFELGQAIEIFGYQLVLIKQQRAVTPSPIHYNTYKTNLC